MSLRKAIGWQVVNYRENALFATSRLLGFFARDSSPPLSFFNFFSSPRGRDKKISTETSLYDHTGQEAYHALKISRIYLPANLCHIQSISCHPSKFCNVLYRIPILPSWLVRLF